MFSVILSFSFTFNPQSFLHTPICSLSLSLSLSFVLSLSLSPDSTSISPFAACLSACLCFGCVGAILSKPAVCLCVCVSANVSVCICVACASVYCARVCFCDSWECCLDILPWTCVFLCIHSFAFVCVAFSFLLEFRGEKITKTLFIYKLFIVSGREKKERIDVFDRLLTQSIALILPCLINASLHGRTLSHLQVCVHNGNSFVIS